MENKKVKIWNIISIITIAVLLITTITLSVILIVKSKKEDDMEKYYYQKCEMFKMENSNFARNQIVFIGDSLTDGCMLDNFYSNLSLATYNRGIGGDTTSGVLKRLKLSLFDINPSKIVLLIGTNDINGGVEVDKILENYRNILKEISTNLPQAEVVCVSLLPLNKQLETYTNIDVDKSMQTIISINPEIEKIVNEFNYNFVDVFDEFVDANNYLIKELSPDGIHLNSDGYVKLTSYIIPHLN